MIRSAYNVKNLRRFFQQNNCKQFLHYSSSKVVQLFLTLTIQHFCKRRKQTDLHWFVYHDLYNLTSTLCFNEYRISKNSLIKLFISWLTAASALAIKFNLLCKTILNLAFHDACSFITFTYLMALWLIFFCNIVYFLVRQKIQRHQNIESFS